MIILFSALYCEARPLIKSLALKKKEMPGYKFPLYQNGPITLSITGTGRVPAAAAVSSLLTVLAPSSADFIINIGTCAAFDENISNTSVYLGNKVIECSTCKTYYPDVVFRHPFDEITILTSDTVYKKGDSFVPRAVIDMEASAIFQSASYFIQPHQLSFLKVVSDYGDCQKISPDFVTSVMERNIEGILSWINILTTLGDDPSYKGFCGFAFTADEDKWIQHLYSDLNCSVTMQHQLIQHLHYAKLIHGSFHKQLHKFYSDYSDCLPSKTKKEGKIYLEQLKLLLLQ